MNLPDNPDPYQILAGNTAPNAFYLCLSTTDLSTLNYVTLTELEEVDTSGYQRLPIVFDIDQASDNSSLTATCDTTLDVNGEEQYLDFICGDNNTSVEINSVYVIASFDDKDFLVYADAIDPPQNWYQSTDTSRVQQITILADTWIYAGA